MFQTDRRVDNGFYIAGWCVIAGVLLTWAAEKITGFHVLGLLPPCAVHTLTGYYCPGCGGTRAVASLLQGGLLRSFCYHPLVLYTVAVGGWFMISQTTERLTRGQIRIGLRFREIYIWIALGIILINFVVKNGALIFWNVDLLQTSYL